MTTLSEDVLYNIFQHACSQNPVSGPLIISHCCRKWRSIVLAMPVLWTHIRIGQLSPRYIRQLSVWLERSKDRHLDIWIDHKHQPSEDSSFYFDHCLTVLASQVNRWGSLTVQARTPPSATTCWMLKHSHIPELTKLSLTSVDINGWGLLLQGSMPKLQDLNLSWRISPRPPDQHKWMSAFSHQGVRRLSIRYPSSYTSLPMSLYLGILRECPHLEDFKFNVRVDGVGHQELENTNQEVLMANLQRFRLVLRRTSIIGHLLGPIHAPKLAHLDAPIHPGCVRNILSKPEFPLPALEYAILESPSSATWLSHSPPLIDFLSRLSELRHLVLVSFEFNRLTSEGGLIVTALSFICPKLQNIELRGCKGPRVGEDIQNLVKSRQDRGAYGISAISSLQIHDPGFYLLEEQFYWLKRNLKTFGYHHLYSSHTGDETEAEDEFEG